MPGPAAGERHRGDQAVPGPRRAEPADPHGQLAAEAEAAVAATRYPPQGVRGVGRRWRGPPAGTGSRTTSPAPRKPSASPCRSSPTAAVDRRGGHPGGGRRGRDLPGPLRPRRLHGPAGTAGTPRGARRRRTLPRRRQSGRQTRRRERLQPRHGPRTTSTTAPPSSWSAPTSPCWPAAPRPSPPQYIPASRGRRRRTPASY